MLLSDFKYRWRQLRDAIARGRAGDIARLWDDVGEQLQAGMKAGEANNEANAYEGMIASGETVVPAMTVCVIDGAVYAADGANADRMASGVAVTGAGSSGKAMWTPGDTLVLCRVKRSTGVTGYGALYQSVTKGVLTNDPEESGLAYVQKVGQWVRWENPKDGSTPDLAWVWLDVCGVSGATADGFVTSVNGQTGDVELGLDDLTGVDLDLSGYKDGAVLQWNEFFDSWIAGSVGSAGAFAPTFVATGSSFEVPVFKQVLFTLPIVVDGEIYIDGDLVEVD